MIHSAKKLSLAAVIAAGIATSAFACMNDNLVVNDVRNNQVHDVRGNCVYTKWTNGTNKCGTIAAGTAFAGLTENERTVYFDFDSDKLTPTAVYKLNRLLQRIKDSGQVLTASIVGHADHLGDASYNQALSARRATAVKSYLDSQGFSNSQVLTVTAEGENAPITEGCDKAGGKSQTINCLQPDRRVEIHLTQVK